MLIRSVRLFSGVAVTIAISACSGTPLKSVAANPALMNPRICGRMDHGYGPVQDPVDEVRPGWRLNTIRHHWMDEDRTTYCFGQIFNDGAFKCQCSVYIETADGPTRL